jgi:hypothetical protein
MDREEARIVWGGGMSHLGHTGLHSNQWGTTISTIVYLSLSFKIADFTFPGGPEGVSGRGA